MTTKNLRDFFETEGFAVHLFRQDKKQCAEIEKWTNGGVDMNISLMPFSKEEFAKFVDYFDIDEEIDLYRQDQKYKNNFTITESVKDFTDFHDMLKVVNENLKLIKK